MTAHVSPKRVGGKGAQKRARSYSIYIDTDEPTGKVLWDLVTRYMWLLQYTINYISARVRWSEEPVDSYYTIVVTPELRTQYKEYKSYEEKVESTRKCLEIQGKRYEEFRHWDKKYRRWLAGFRVYYTAKRRTPELPEYKEIYDELRPKLLEMWGEYAAHYVDSIIQYAYNTVMKSWKELYEEGMARKKKPVMRRRTIYLKNTLFRVRDGELIITLIPRKRYLKVPIDGQWFLERVDGWRLGAVLIKELEPRGRYRVILQYTKEREKFEPESYLSIDLNMDTIDLLLYAPGTTKLWITIDWSELIRWIRKHHDERSKIQSRLAHARRDNLRGALERLSIKYRNYTKDIVNKTAKYILSLAEAYSAVIIVEDLKKNQMYRNKEWNKELQMRLWKRLIQELKKRWFVREVDPYCTTRTCSNCGSKKTIVQGLTVKCTKCGITINRQLNACINIMKKATNITITNQIKREKISIKDIL